MSVTEWLNEAIAEQAAEDGALDDDFDDHSGDAEQDFSAISDRLAQSIARIDRRLDNISAQVSASATQYRPAGPEAYAPPRHWQEQWAPPPPPANYGGDWSREVDTAVAEISARQRALEIDPESPPAPSRPAFQNCDPALPVPVQQMAAPQWMPPPPPSVDLSGLEAQLNNITEQIKTLSRPSASDDALAELRNDLREITRTIIDAMPRQAIEALEGEMRRLTERLAQGHQDGAEPGLIGDMARSLLEVRDHLRALTPAENLGGLIDTIQALAHKIDTMSGPGHAAPDAGNIHQLEEAIGALRGVVSHVASNEALGHLADEVRGLSMRIEQVAAQASDRTLGPELEAQLRAFTQQLQQQNEHNAFGQLQDRISALATKLDASDARLTHLDTIERELRGIVDHLGELRGGSAPKAAPAVDSLQRDISRTQDSVEAVHGTVENVVDRLAMIEDEIRENHMTRDMPKPSATPKLAIPAVAPEAVRAAPPTPRERVPIDPNLPHDYPLEPGSGTPQARIVSAADRIAASEAALGGSKGAASGSTNFIAAARRAAKSAAPAAQAEPTVVEEKPAAPKSLTQRMRGLLGGAAVILLLAGGYYAAPKIFDPLGSSDLLNAGFTNPLLATAPANLDIAAKALEPDDEDDGEPALAAPETKPAQVARSVEPVPTWVAPQSGTDVTGSIPKAQLSKPTLNLPDFAPDKGASLKLPASLRDAAASDPAAAYDIAMRHLDGRGVPASTEEAARWLQQAAKGGLAPAQFRLGSLYEKGQGVKKNLDAARQLYQAAAERGNAKAMHNLAVLYAEGLDGKSDYKTAAIWFLKAAEHGVADSQYNLGILYARGIGVEQNLPESYKWFALAAAQGDKDSGKKRDDVATRLDAGALNAAKLAVKTFTARPQPEEAVTVKLPEEKPVHPVAPARPKRAAPAPAPISAPLKISPT